MAMKKIRHNADIKQRLLGLGMTVDDFAHALGKNPNTVRCQMYKPIGPKTRQLWETTLDGLEAARGIKKDQ